MGYESSRDLEGDFFKIWKSNKGGKPLKHFIDKTNLENYYIYKSTGNFREVSIEDFKEFKYASYIFLSKKLHNNIEINESIDEIYSKGMYPQYLNKPLPKLEIIKKIKVIDGIWNK